MKIIFKGDLANSEAADGFYSIMNLFKDRYGIDFFRGMTVTMTMLDSDGEEVELVDAETCQVFDLFEISKAGHIRQRSSQEKEGIRLVVDNTKKNRFGIED